MSAALVTSRLLPVPHGFTTRHGGVSEGAWASLNVGFSVGDQKERVEENLRRIGALVQVGPAELHTVSQVHGVGVLPIDRPCEVPFAAGGEADALWTARAGALVGVKTADCVPLLLVDPVGRKVAAVHSGWRGTVARIARQAVRELEAAGSAPGELLAAIGPAIQACCYQVSDELAERFRAELGEQVVVRGGQAPRLDLPRAVKETLVAAGVRSSHIDLLARCTSCERGEFFSHRRDEGRTGRHLSFAVCRF